LELLVRFCVWLYRLVIWFVAFGVIPMSSASEIMSKLWLPISYQSHFNRLLDAAEKVDNLEDCHQFVRGTLSEKKSTKQSLVFSMRCRNKDKHTFTLMVRADDLTITRIDDVWLEEDKTLAELKKQEKLRRHLMNRAQYWSVCESTLQEKIKNYDQVNVVTSFPVKPDITDTGGFTYFIEFEAMGPKGSVLIYMAEAEIDYLDECRILIRPF
jgi:hypothetical protein